ncbi:hypothetical protein Bbelb_237140 [Branchiostoma belcheri]|nr:hypothetical protein Bbelb_237140 [Branchiostoma belcheri]
MEYTGKPPQINWDSANLDEEWKRFKQHVELMFTGPLSEKSDAEKASFLQIWINEQGRDILNTFQFADGADKGKPKTYYDAFEAYVKPKSNKVLARFKFHNRTQGPQEPVEQFVTDLKLLARDCAFKDTDEMIVDRLVFGTNSDAVRVKLINKGSELTLANALDIARSFESSQSTLKSITQSAATVHGVQTQHKTRDVRSYKKARASGGSGGIPKYTSTRPTNTCGRCGRKHQKGDRCAAVGQTCRKCSRPNHFASVCRTKNVQEVRTVEEDLHAFHIETVCRKHEEGDQAFVELHIAGRNDILRCKLDTGAQVNVLPEKEWKKLKGRNQTLKPTKTRLYGYGNMQIEVLGECSLPCKHRGRSQNLSFFVVKANSTPVLSLSACLSLKLIQLVLAVDAIQTAEEIKKEYKDVFEGIGQFPGKHRIRVDPDVQPVVHAPRKIPVSLRDPLKKELDRMEALGVIQKVDEPTEWVNSLVVVEKPRTGKLRICLDPRDLNKAIKREHYQLPTLEDVATRLAGSKYFSVVDARSGYWQICLDEESSKLTTFNTAFGRYRFTRLPFGVHSAQEVFQKQMDNIFQGLDGVEVIVDDILVHGPTLEEHNTRLRNMFQRARENRVKLNEDKCILASPEVGYFGHTLTKDGLKPDPKKIEAITGMKPPANKAEVMTMLGMVNYLAKFTPNLSEVTAPIRELLRDDVEFVWDDKRERAFSDTKKVVAEASTLSYYDPSREVILQVDASKHGLGAVLLQDNKPVAYASKSLNATEVNYAQIEKELYAIVFGCERFHQYIYGRKVTVESDHKPLEAITRKPLSSAPARLQRMLLRLQKYDLAVQHRPGKEIPVADALSRLYLKETDNMSETFEAQVHLVTSNIPVSSQRIEEVRQETGRDPQLIILMDTIREGWPDTKRQCDTRVTEYWNHRDELTIEKGVIFKGQKIVIPKAMRREMLDILHEGHLGQEKTKARARDILFWPGMNGQIDEKVQKCVTCQENRASNAKEPLMPHPTPQRPWQKVATDLFHWDGKDFVLVVDYYSKYVELHKLEHTRSTDVITKLKKTFAAHGIPEEVISDNGPQYASEEFRKFARAWSFKHTTSSPRYPQSNGLAERTVQTMKHLLEKTRADKKEPFLALLEYRNTPVNNALPSPAQLLMGRRLRTRLPTTNEQLMPQSVNHKDVRQQLQDKQQRQKTWYDRNARSLPTLTPGNAVRMQQTNGKWTPATVVSKCDQPRSYIIQTPEGAQYRRNNKHLLKTNAYPRSGSPTPASGDNTPAMTVTSNAPAETTPPVTTTPVVTAPPAAAYVTRSGRTVNPPTKLDL